MRTSTDRSAQVRSASSQALSVAFADLLWRMEEVLPMLVSAAQAKVTVELMVQMPAGPDRVRAQRALMLVDEGEVLVTEAFGLVEDAVHAYRVDVEQRVAVAVHARGVDADTARDVDRDRALDDVVARGERMLARFRPRPVNASNHHSPML